MFVSVTEKLKEQHLERFIDYVENINILASSEPIRVLHWQPCDCLKFSRTHGFIPDSNKSLEDEALYFIQRATGKYSFSEPALIMTPEYSFPYSIIEKIMGDSSLWPKESQLWCLSMQGHPTKDFLDLIDSANNTDNVSVLFPKFECKNEYVNALFYIISRKSSEGIELLLMPQLKIQHASDRGGETESTYMEKGTEVLLLTNPILRTSFVSLICADLLNARLVSQFFQNDIQIDGIDTLHGYTFNVFNPQLNIKPFHESYCTNIDSALGFKHPSTFRFIALNWSTGTKICGKKINHGLSALLCEHDNLESETKNQAQRKGVIIRNPSKGSLMACFPSCKHILMYVISASNCVGQSKAIGDTPQFLPLDIFTSQEDKWMAETTLCQIDWIWINKNFSPLAGRHRKADVSSINNCQNTNVNDFFLTFFASGHVAAEYQINEPFVKKVGNDAAVKREKLERIALCVREKNLPEPLKPFENTCYWIFEETNRNLSVRTGEQSIHNVRLLHADTQYEATIVYGNALGKENTSHSRCIPIYVYYPTAKGYDIFYKQTTDISFLTDIPEATDISFATDIPEMTKAYHSTDISI